MPPNVADDFKSTVTRSFRFETEMSRVLDEEAERMGISVNALVGIILKRYVEFTRYLSKIDMVIVNREFLTRLFEEIPEDKLGDVGYGMGLTVSSDTIMFWKKEISERSLLEYIEKMICRYGQLGTYDEIMQGGQRTIVIRHRLGRKGSKFFEGYLKATLKKTIDIETNFELTESSIKFEIKLRNHGFPSKS